LVADKITQSQPQRWTPHAELQQSQREDLQRRLTLAKETERSIADELLQLENERLHQALHTVQKLPQTEATVTATPPTRSPLEEKYEQMLEQRKVLLRAKTEAHPLVQELDGNLAEVKASLQSEVKSILKPTATVTTPPIEQVQSALQASEQKRTDLMEQRNELRGRIESLEADLKRLEQPLPDFALETKISQPTTIIERQGGQPGWWKLTLFSLASSGLGIVTYFLVSQVSRQRVFHTWSQVREELQLEVLGAPSTLENFSQRGTRVEFCLRNSILLAELVVFVLSITLTYALATQSQLTQPPLHDPWGAVAEALDRVGEETVRR
jgi:predicted  nucleic acid-binding Zn-ribbon protein